MEARPGEAGGQRPQAGPAASAGDQPVIAARPHPRAIRGFEHGHQAADGILLDRHQFQLVADPLRHRGVQQPVQFRPAQPAAGILRHLGQRQVEQPLAVGQVDAPPPPGQRGGLHRGMPRRQVQPQRLHRIGTEGETGAGVPRVVGRPPVIGIHGDAGNAHQHFGQYAAGDAAVDDADPHAPGVMRRDAGCPAGRGRAPGRSARCGSGSARDGSGSSAG